MRVCLFLIANWVVPTVIAVGSLVVILLIAFLLYYLIALKKKKVMNNQAKEYYVKIIEAVGGIDNIVEVSVNSSRLSFVLKDYSKLNSQILENVGIVKSSKKVTLVIGSMAQEYCKKISNELNK